MKLIAALTIAILMSGCATMHVSERANGESIYADHKPLPILKGLYIFTIPFDLITAPIQFYLLGKAFES